ncbi:MAG: hypothetical protein H7329_20565 [Opitutaceae bacterium]|nr:hypothetical protein [Cytophagales bacterium]
MKESNEILDRIELYSKGKMSFEEKLSFEKELSSDDTLQNQLEFSQIVDRMIIAGEALKLKEQMGKDLNGSKTNAWSYLAGSVFLLSTIAGLFMLFNRKEDKPKIVNQVSISPKIIRRVENTEGNRVEVQNPTLPIPKNKSVSKQEQKTNGSSSLPEPKTVFIDPVSSTQMPVSGSNSGPTVEHEKTAVVQANTEVIKNDLCASLIGEVEYNMVPSCKGQETGEVHLKAGTVKGGQGPFSFSMGNKSSQSSFSHLASGQYSLFIRDANGCSVENSKKVVIGEKNCQARKEYVFNPEYDPSWLIPFDTDKKAINFVIHEKSGKVFFQSTVSASQPSEWKGESNSGLTLGVGVYFFTIEYSDSSVDEGSIVVSR